MMNKRRLRFSWLLTIVSFASPVFAAAKPGMPSVLIRDVPHIQQKPDFRGEACVAMALQKHGKPADQDFVFDQSGLSPLHGRGCYTKELADAVRNVGFDPGKVWYKFRPASAAANTDQLTDADYAQHILKLKQRLPGKDFHIVLEKPFVVIGDDAAETVQGHSTNTVQWAVRRLKQDYFTKDPIHIVDIWLFKGKDSYEQNCVTLFGSKPGTPYGYYSSANKALVMNISTGGGTLVHEIVHPFIEANFPDCPSWFNEGLASLYEQCRDDGGHIRGNTNWRLNGLKEAIANKRVPLFKTLCSTTRHEFYEEDPGTNYSQARYLCYYLQEQGLLTQFYHEFRINAATDPTGYQTLQSVLGTDDMDAFKQRWEAYTAALRF
ncbi:MAG: hypothetical protein O2856_17640 [Planctomycetota bacterium]|nr:hypothetical protein [Planctomycetota bacterium]